MIKLIRLVTLAETFTQREVQIFMVTGWEDMVTGWEDMVTGWEDILVKNARGITGQ